MNLKQNKNIIVAIIILLVAVGAFIVLRNPTDEQANIADQAPLSQDQAPSSEVDTTQSPTPASADWKVYNNTDYGFQLTFRDSWKGYKVVKGSNPIEVYYAVCVPTSDKTWQSEPNCPSGYADPMVISVFSIQEWKELQQDSSAYKPHVKLGQNNKYVVAYTMWQDLPSDFRDTNLGYGAIVDSFKFMK